MSSTFEPRTTWELMHELYGLVDSCPDLWQGMVRYWLDWRAPWIVRAIKETKGLKLYYTASTASFSQQLPKLLLLPDLLIIGQSGPLFEREMLTIAMPLDQTLPRINEVRDNLQALAVSFRRPVPNGIMSALDRLRELALTGRTIYAPLATMFAPDKHCKRTKIGPEKAMGEAIRQAYPEGLPIGALYGRRIPESDVEKALPKQEGLPTVIAAWIDKEASKSEDSIQEEKEEPCFVNGRLTYKKYLDKIGVEDRSWGGKETYAFDLRLAELLDTVPVIGDHFPQSMPQSEFILRLQIPFVEGSSILPLLHMMESEPSALTIFRNVIKEGVDEVRETNDPQHLKSVLNRVQRTIDDGIARLSDKWKHICKTRFARYGLYSAGMLTVTASIFPNISPQSLLAFLSTFGLAAFNEQRERLGESKELRSEPMYFVWKLGRSRK